MNGDATVLSGAHDILLETCWLQPFRGIQLEITPSFLERCLDQQGDIMKTLLLYAFLLQAWLPVLNAASIYVPLGGETRLDLDLDGDGRSEVQTLFSGDTGGGGFSFNVDFLNNYSTILGLPFNAIITASFSDLNELMASDFFGLALSIPAYTSRDSDIGGGFAGFSNIGAAWMFGTFGTGNDPVSVVGLVLDAREYSGSSGNAPMALYTHFYGLYAPGQRPFLSLAATGVPEASTTVLTAFSLMIFVRRRR